MKNRTIFLLVLTVFLEIACHSDKTVQKPDEWIRNAVIYEVNVRQYTPEGTFKSFATHLPRLKELGVDVLWFMPVYPISQQARKGSLGSYYAVRDYKAINPEFGTASDFKSLVDKAHAMGFKVVLDWVANHTGRDHIWLKQHPEWFERDSLGLVVSPHDWTDVAKVDYRNKNMRLAMEDAMLYWIKEFDIDGFRCDVAGEVPTAFWETVSAKLNKTKPLFMLAEADKAELTKKAFQADYNWPLLGVMNDIAKGRKVAKDLDKIKIHQDSLYSPFTFKMNFVTNHDENSWNGSEYERMGAGVKAFAVLTYTYPGLPLIYSGQEVGLRKRLSFFEKDTIPSWKNDLIFSFYQQLNQLKHTQPALGVGQKAGQFIRYLTTSPSLYIFERKIKSNRILVVLNLSAQTQEIKFVHAIPAGMFDEFFQHAAINVSQLDGTFLAPWQYRVYVNRKK